MRGSQVPDCDCPAACKGPFCDQGQPAPSPGVLSSCDEGLNDNQCTNLVIFSSSLSLGSMAKLLSYISCTSPAACMLLKM